MKSKKTALPERVFVSYQKLSVAASDINTASDELGEAVSELDAALKKLNLGVTAWTTIRGTTNQAGDYWCDDEIGFAKIGNKWGIALRKVSGNQYDPESETEEAWLFNDAPRLLRIEGVEKLPDLLDKLIQETQKTAKHIKSNAAYAKELATAIAATEVASESDSRENRQGEGRKS